jgi:hypothetical protein
MDLDREFGWTLARKEIIERFREAQRATYEAMRVLGQSWGMDAAARRVRTRP